MSCISLFFFFVETFFQSCFVLLCSNVSMNRMLLQVFLKQNLSNVVFDSNFNDEGLCFFSFLYLMFDFYH